MTDHPDDALAAELAATIKQMTERFLQWRLPADFNPDGGIRFTPTFNTGIPPKPMAHNPTGTNLFSYTQAEAMVRHMVAALNTRPSASVEEVERHLSGETVCGYPVAAYRETHPEHGDKYGHSYSEHWSTPNSRDPRVKVERLFTEDQLRAALRAGDVR